jgi:hypothetical protein
MAETNGSGRLDDHEQRISRLEAARKDIEDTLVVMAYLESKAGERIKEHAEFIASEEASMRRHTIRMDEFDDKLNALIKIVSRMQGGIESQS